MDIININHFAQLDVIPVPSPCSGSRKTSMTKGEERARVLTSGSGWRSQELPAGWVDVSHTTPPVELITCRPAYTQAEVLMPHNSNCILVFSQEYTKRLLVIRAGEICLKSTLHLRVSVIYSLSSHYTGHRLPLSNSCPKAGVFMSTDNNCYLQCLFLPAFPLLTTWWRLETW
jgi:hypothetical protein